MIFKTTEILEEKQPEESTKYKTAPEKTLFCVEVEDIDKTNLRQGHYEDSFLSRITYYISS